MVGSGNYKNAIRARLDALGARDRAEKQMFARAEKWRDRLLGGDAAALEAFENELGETDDELRRLLTQLEVTYNERAEKTLKREVFRRVHANLVRISK